MKCRHCAEPLEHVFIDLATAPPSNAYRSEAELRSPERYFPLRVMVCARCWLVQTEDYTDANELFTSDYAYFSSFSSSWLQHCEDYVSAMADRFALGPASRVVEIAANDGCLLHFVQQRGIPCYGVEPTASTAQAARAKGITIVQDFFGLTLAEDLAARGLGADLVAANNVLAHVPDINDFVSGFAHLLNADGVVTFEFPHLLRLVAENQFDTIYHEHYSYLSLTATQQILNRNGLRIFDVEELPTHGGSLRVYAQREDFGTRAVQARVEALLARETDAGMCRLDFYRDFQARANRVKDEFLRFLLDAKQDGLRVAGYGAAAKGNTLLNYAGVHADLLPYVVDRNPNKQGKYLPGSLIPIVGIEHLERERPDRVVILPWNLTKEVVTQLPQVSSWGGKFVRAIPSLQVLAD